MPIFTAENRSAWQEVFSSVEKDRPSVGKRITVVKGKYKGFQGVVVWHGRNKYYDTRYMSGAQIAMMQSMGTDGYRVAIDIDGKRIFIDAKNVEILR